MLKRPRKIKKKEDKKEEAPVADFLILGADATASIITQTRTKAHDIYEHKKPEDLAFDELQDITEVSHQMLGQFMQYFTNMHCFALQGAATADLQSQASKTHLDVLKKQYFLLNGDDDKIPKYKLEAQALKDPAIAKAEHRNFECRALHKMMGAQVLALEHKVALFSREISRRSADLTATPRAN